MLQVTDSRFQDELARKAKDAGKLPRNYEIAAAYRDNSPDRIARALKPAREAGLLPSFPFGSDFTDVEQRLIPALQLLADAQRSPRRLPGLLVAGFYPHAGCCRRRMPGAARPRCARDICRARLPRAGQRRAGAEQGGINYRRRRRWQSVTGPPFKTVGTAQARLCPPYGLRHWRASICSCSPACAFR